MSATVIFAATVRCCNSRCVAQPLKQNASSTTVTPVRQWTKRNSISFRIATTSHATAKVHERRQYTDCKSCIGFAGWASEPVSPKFVPRAAVDGQFHRRFGDELPIMSFAVPPANKKP